VVINIVGMETITVLKIPLYLDAIGTVIVAILAGPFAGALAGTLTNVIAGIIFSPVDLPFVPVALMIGLVAGWLARIGGFRTWWLAMISGAIIGVPTTIMATPIIVFMFGGVTGSGPDFASAYMMALGSSLLKSVGLTNLGISIVDKSLTALIAFIVANRLPLRLSTSFRFFAYSKA
jgi:energy-coupling factor transport system substrate-specific component